MVAKFAVLALAVLCVAQAVPLPTGGMFSLLNLEQETQARDLNTCFGVLAQNRELLAKLEQLMTSSKDLLFPLAAELYLCHKDDVVSPKACIAEVQKKYRSAVSSTLKNNLAWKDGAQDLIGSLKTCMVA